MGSSSNKYPSCMLMEACINGVNYWETYSPVVNWMSARAILTLSILRELHANPVDFILSYTQAGVKSDIFMELPIGFGVEGAYPR